MKRLIGTLILATGLLAAQGAAAANISANTAHKIGAKLTSAYLTATAVERDIQRAEGDTASPSVINGIKVITQSVSAADALVAGNPYLAPGTEHVLENLGMLVKNGTFGKNHASIINEIVIELHTMSINATILQAEDHLNSAAKALAKGKRTDLKYYLEQAVADLEEANNRGAYHLQNDLEELRSALTDLAAKVDAQLAIDPEAITERIAEVHEHLYELRPKG